MSLSSSQTTTAASSVTMNKTSDTVASVSLSSDISEVIKLRLTALVLLTTMAGFYMGTTGALNWMLLLHCLAGTGLVASAAAALNQYLERREDRRMRRTENRPLATGRLAKDEVVVLASAAAVIGIFYLATMTHVFAGILAGFTIWLYLAVYTPLKRKTAWNTLIGAVPGALPPVIGYVAASGRFDLMAAALFGILFFWQLPHFLAIAWLYREDYERGGFVMTPLGDTEGVRTGTQSFLFSLALIPVSIVPFFVDAAGWLYLLAAVAFGTIYAANAWQFMLEPNNKTAKRLFFASILYLPALLVFLTLAKLG